MIYSVIETAGNPIWDVREIEEVLSMAIEALTNKNLKKPKNTREVNEEIVGCTYCIHKYEYQCAFMDGEYNVNGDCHWGERIEKLDGKG